MITLNDPASILGIGELVLAGLEVKLHQAALDRKSPDPATRRAADEVFLKARRLIDKLEAGDGRLVPHSVGEFT